MSIILTIDSETTGIPSPDFTPEIVQLAAILQDDGTRRVLGELNVIVRTSEPIPAETTAIHGIDDRMSAAYGLAPLMVEGLLISLAGMADTIVAHNLAFDMKVIQGVWPVAHEILASKRQFCTMLESTALVGLHGTHAGGKKWPRLKEAYIHFYGLEPEGQHDAMMDARACRDIYCKLLEGKNNG
jgi:DNA polymerase-3 subunit epsilon